MTAPDQPYMTNDELQHYIDGRIAADRALRAPVAAAPRPGFLRRVGISLGNAVILVLIGLVITVFALVARVQYGLPIPLPDSLVGTAAVTFSTAVAPLPTARQSFSAPAQQQPFTSGGAAPWPTLTPTEEGVRPTLTVPAVPTATEGFWNPTEAAAFTATAEAFYQPETLPTAPPEFTAYVDERCKDPEVVAESPTLQLFCGEK